MEIAAATVRTHVPLVALVERDETMGRLLGAVSVAGLMWHLLAAGGQT
ncbi:hypothetical protein [Streptomyces sp. NPDC003863]